MATPSSRSFLRNYYLFSFFYDFIFAYAVYNALFQLRGLSVFQISILLAWWAFVAMVLEVPTGALADKWNRKTMLTLAPVLKSFCFLCWYIASGNFWLYALGFVFWALGSTFVSGTTESLLFDTLKNAGVEETYNVVLSKKKFFFHIALAISMIAGGFIASFNIDWAILSSVMPLALCALFAFRLTNAPKAEAARSIHYLDHIREGIKEVRMNRVLLPLILYLLGIALFADLEEFDQLYYQLVHLPLWAFGIVGFLLSVGNAAGASFAHRLQGMTVPFYLLPFLCGLLLIIVGIWPSIPALVALEASYLLSTPVHIITEGNIQYAIRSTSRATVTSVTTLLVNLTGIVITICIGLISKFWGLQSAYVVFAVFLIGFAIWAYGRRHAISLQLSRKTSRMLTVDLTPRQVSPPHPPSSLP
ncbi:MAG: MFS transporter [Candidatus Peribacteraceae bacterium]|nr:MFS transporter [Candidatus Peribacteraceae bacterium]